MLYFISFLAMQESGNYLIREYLNDQYPWRFTLSGLIELEATFFAGAILLTPLYYYIGLKFYTNKQLLGWIRIFILFALIQQSILIYQNIITEDMGYARSIYQNGKFKIESEIGRRLDIPFWKSSEPINDNFDSFDRRNFAIERSGHWVLTLTMWVWPSIHLLYFLPQMCIRRIKRDLWPDSTNQSSKIL